MKTISFYLTVMLLVNVPLFTSAKSLSQTAKKFSSDIKNNNQQQIITKNLKTQFKLELSKGWNLVSIPIVPEDRSVQSIFSPYQTHE